MSHTLTVRNVPDSILKALRCRARGNKRSMQKELISILAEAASDRSSLMEQLRSVRARVGAKMTLVEIQRAIDEGRA